MVQLAMVIIGLTAGVKAKGWRQAVAVVLVVFAAVLAIQTALVASDDRLRSTADNLIYWPVQVLALLVALGVARWLIRWRSRRASTARTTDQALR